MGDCAWGTVDAGLLKVEDLRVGAWGSGFRVVQTVEQGVGIRDFRSVSDAGLSNVEGLGLRPQGLFVA